MIKNKNKIKVFVGVSGGVDSSVALALLKNEGYDVTGVFIKTWQPDFIECTWKEERRDAIRVCAALDVPFLTFDLENDYKRGVADYMISEYKLGRIPNPDVMCNREVKFGAFWKRAKSMGADFIATGHYAQNIYNKNDESFELVKSIDETKDQSYFLYRLNNKDLSHVLFPIGKYKKSQIRVLAKKFKLPTANKKDSQGICMLGDLDVKDFLSHYIKNKKGNVLNENGEVIGNHDGAYVFALGERHGFTITAKNSNSKPYYVISKDMKKNTITVGLKSQNLVPANKAGITISNLSFVNEPPVLGKKYTAQIRYHGEFEKCEILEVSKENIKIFFKNNVLVSPGQSVVLYENIVCLGGGIVI